MENHMQKLTQEALATKRETLLRKREVLRQTGLSNSSLYVYIKRGLIKPGVPIGPRMKGWPASEIDAYVQSCIAQRDSQQAGAAK
jgi:predicted DNA-binding transcriptional regulator AlpA